MRQSTLMRIVIILKNAAYYRCDSVKGELNARPRRFSRNDALDAHADGARIVADLHLGDER